MEPNDPFANDPAAAAPQPAPSAPETGGRSKKVVISVVLVAAGLLIGGAATGIAVASAKGNSASASSAAGGDKGRDDHDGNRPAGGPGAPGGPELTGDALTKVTDAIAAKYPGATIERAFPTPDGGYIAHAITADGEKYVTLGANFAVTGEQSEPGGPGGPRPDGDHGPGDHGPGDDDHGPGDDDHGGITLPSDGATGAAA